jgi:hypothetical protein
MNLVKSFTILAFVAATGSSMAQGLLSLRPQRDVFEKRLPLSWSVAAGMGYDSNVNLSSNNEHDSLYAQAAINARYQSGDRQTSYGIDAGYSAFQFADAPANQDEFMQAFRAGVNFRHKVNPRLVITDSAYFAYEFEPNYSIGAGTTRRSEPYIYGFNNLSVAYAWSRRLSTVTGYTVSGIDYSDFDGESFLNHTFNHEFRYQLGRATVGVLEYRLATSSYDNNFGDYSSNYFLVGVDHSLTRRLYTSLRAGAEFRDRDFGGSGTSPYVEGVLTYRASEDTTLSSYVRYGYDDSTIGFYQDRTSIRIGANVSSRLNSRTSVFAGAHYIHDVYEDSFIDAGNFEDDVFALNAGVDYQIYKNVSLYAGYSFTTSSSGNDIREYDRHNMNIGLRAQF